MDIDVDESYSLCVSNNGDRVSPDRETSDGIPGDSADLSTVVICKSDPIADITSIESFDDRVSGDCFLASHNREPKHDVPGSSTDSWKNIPTIILCGNSVSDSETDTASEQPLSSPVKELELAHLQDAVTDGCDETPKPVLLVKNIFCDDVSSTADNNHPQENATLQSNSALQTCKNESATCTKDSTHIRNALHDYLTKQITDSNDHSEVTEMVIAGMDYVNTLLQTSVPDYTLSYYDLCYQNHISNVQEAESDRQKLLKKMEVVCPEEKKQNLNTFKEFQELMNSKTDSLANIMDMKRRKHKKSRRKDIDKLTVRKVDNPHSQINLSKIPGHRMSSDTLFGRKRSTSDSANIDETMNDKDQSNVPPQDCTLEQPSPDVLVKDEDPNVDILKDFQASMKSGKARTKLSVIVKGKRHIEVPNTRLCGIKMQEIAAKSQDGNHIKVAKKDSDIESDFTNHDNHGSLKRCSDPECRINRSHSIDSNTNKITSDRNNSTLCPEASPSEGMDSKSEESKIMEMVNAGIDYVSSLLHKYKKKKDENKQHDSDTAIRSSVQISSRTIFTENVKKDDVGT